MKFTKVEVMRSPSFPMMGPGMWQPDHLYILFMADGEDFIFTRRGWAPWKSGQSIAQVLEDYNG